MNISFNIKKSYFIALFVLVLVGVVYAAVGHPSSQIIVDSNLNMNNKKITGLGEHACDAAESGCISTKKQMHLQVLPPNLFAIH